jgi:hypothetical protein
MKKSGKPLTLKMKGGIMFTVRKSFLVSVLVFFIINLIGLLLEGMVMSIAINIVIPLNYYTPDQFILSCTILSFGALCLMNAFLLKAGLYETIKRHMEEN